MRTAVPLEERGVARYFFAHVLPGQSFRTRALSAWDPFLLNSDCFPVFRFVGRR